MLEKQVKLCSQSYECLSSRSINNYQSGPVQISFLTGPLSLYN